MPFRLNLLLGAELGKGVAFRCAVTQIDWGSFAFFAVAFAPDADGIVVFQCFRVSADSRCQQGDGELGFEQAEVHDCAGAQG